MGKRILLVDDDVLMRRSLAFNLQQSGYQIQTAASAEDALEITGRQPPDLVLLDIGLPGMDGLEALRQMRNGQGIPVILITARRRELDEVLGLELGADDYITKPFDLDVLLAHIKAVLRRVKGSPNLTALTAMIVAGDLTLDVAAHSASIAGKPVSLPPLQFKILHLLAANAGKVVTTADLLSQVWGAEYVGQPQVVYVHIRWLREKIEANPQKPARIVTVRGVGYKFLPVEE